MGTEVMVIFHDNFTNRNGDLTGCLEVSGWQILVAHHDGDCTVVPQVVS